MRILAIRDKGWFDKNTDRRLYDQTCRAYGVEFEMLESLESLKVTPGLIVCDQNGKEDLDGFVHPDDAQYLFGRTAQNLAALFPVALTLRIPTPNNISLFGAVACGIILEDRRRKWLYEPR